MLRFLLPLILVLPFVELYVLIFLAGSIGFLETLAVVIITGLIGAEILRREGRFVLAKLRTSVSMAEASRNMIEGFLLVLTGVFLLTPGIITDVIGFIIVVRPVRERLAVRISRFFKDKGNVQVVRI